MRSTFSIRSLGISPIHETETVPVGIQVLHLAMAHLRGLECFPALEGAIQNRARDQALKLQAHEGATFARLHVLVLDDGEGLAVELDPRTGPHL
jgi:hypothetical protein